MLIRKPQDVDARAMDMPGAEGVTMRLMVGRDDGAPNFAMRLFEVEPGGCTPRHSHNYEHEIMILQGQAMVGKDNDAANDEVANAGDVLYIPANQTHQFRNTGDEPLKFMCFVPTEFDCGGTAANSGIFLIRHDNATGQPGLICPNPAPGSDTDDEDQTMSQEKPAKSPSFFSTPHGMFAVAALLMIASAIVSLTVSIALSQVAFPDPAGEKVIKYIAYLCSVILAMASVYTLVAGAVRCGVYGRACRGIPTSGKANEEGDLLTQLQIISDRMLLSDTAKRIAYRQEDVNALREAIRDDIAKKDFDAAMVLVREMSQTFGYREEAEEFREQIATARSSEIDARITVLLQRLDQIIAAHDFNQAMADALKIKRIYPDNPRVQDLDKIVAKAQEDYKHQLERDFLAAAQKDDVDGAIELLKALDVYLTEREAEPFREVARGVIGKKRDNLGVQFKMAVHDKEWLKAIRVGEQIIKDFPNTRMAEEVRDRLDQLRERAAGQQAAQNV